MGMASKKPKNEKFSKDDRVFIYFNEKTDQWEGKKTKDTIEEYGKVISVTPKKVKVKFDSDGGVYSVKKEYVFPASEKKSSKKKKKEEEEIEDELDEDLDDLLEDDDLEDDDLEDEEEDELDEEEDELDEEEDEDEEEEEEDEEDEEEDEDEEEEEEDEEEEEEEDEEEDEEEEEEEEKPKGKKKKGKKSSDDDDEAWFSAGDDDEGEFDTSYGTYRFWIPKGEKRVITFLTDKPLTYREHQARIGGSFNNYFTCVAPMGKRCPMCEAGVKSYPAKAFYIVDHSEYTNKEGKKVKDQVRLLVIKKQAYALMKENIAEHFEDEDISYKGLRMVVKRTRNKQAPTTGNVFVIKGKKKVKVDKNKKISFDDLKTELKPLEKDVLKKKINFIEEDDWDDEE